MFKFLKSLFQLILSPVRGWEDISYAGEDYRRLAAEGLYPLLGVASLTVFMAAIYRHGVELSYMIQQAIVTFVKYFVGYFIAVFILGSYIHRDSDAEISEKRNHTFVIYSIGLLAIISIIKNCLPMNLATLNFLPIYVAIVMWRGTRYMAIRPDRVGYFMILAIGAVIVPPFVIGFLFNLVIPGA